VNEGIWDDRADLAWERAAVGLHRERDGAALDGCRRGKGVDAVAAGNRGVGKSMALG
jgi:hypothetical protein